MVKHFHTKVGQLPRKISFLQFLTKKTIDFQIKMECDLNSTEPNIK